MALLMWAYRKSENPSPTEVEYYWNKPKLCTVGISLKFIKAAEMSKTQHQPMHELLDSSTFLKDVMTISKEKNLDSQLS